MSAKSPARSAGPPSSPRLPSPPPLPELQLGPRSPSINAIAGELTLEEAAAQDEGAARRIRPGTSALEMARGPPFVPLHQLESPFQLQEYLKSSYSDLTRDFSSDTVKPITKESAMQLATPPIQQDTGDPVDRNLWLYELCRFLVQRTNRLIVSFFADNPPCSGQTCPEMRASEWQYLCAVHEPPKSCCAIDYCCHTLDWAANVLTSPKHFPSRLSLGGEGGSAYQSMRQLTNIFRRVYRIYAHAWFQHREAFWSLEQEEGLYKFFRTVCDVYALIPEDNYTIPSEAEAEREDIADTPVMPRPGTQILKNDSLPEPSLQEADSESTVSTTGPTVRRHGHRHTPSTGTHVTVITEGPEEEEDGAHAKEQSEPQIGSLGPLPSPQLKVETSPRSPRSPRPTMSIPINDIKEDIHIPEDPTPTPERHNLDFFSDKATVQAVQEATAKMEHPPAFAPWNRLAVEPSAQEPATPLTATVAYKERSFPPILNKPPIPPLRTRTPPRSIDEGDVVRSPGGGSIRTVGGDILSGILAHTDNDRHDDHQAESNGGAGSSADIANIANIEKQIESSKVTEKEEIESEAEKGSVSTVETGLERTDEALEDMGEIKLVETAIPINNGDSDEHAMQEKDSTIETTKESPPEEKKITKIDDDEKRDDGTTADETPSGVV